MFDSDTKLQSKKNTCFGENFSSRIDRIYATSDVSAVSARVLPNQFSDHDTVITQFDIHLQPSRGRGYWKNNVNVFKTTLFCKISKTNGKIGRKQKTAWALSSGGLELKTKGL